MKENYEDRAKMYLTRRTPVIIRLDGKAFHTFTKGFKKPFDDIMVRAMQETCKYLCNNIQGCKVAYTQSDEISLLLTDYNALETDAWFDYSVQKMCSVSASMATLAFNTAFSKIVYDLLSSSKSAKELGFESEEEINEALEVYTSKMNKALFDSRVFNMPKEEVCNYFLWRQQDATRNAIQSLAQSKFSHKALKGKSCNELQDMLYTEHGINFNDLQTHLKRGSCIYRTTKEVEGKVKAEVYYDLEIPIFSQDREYIEKFL